MKINFYANIVSHWFTYLFSRQKCLLNCLAHPFLSLERGIHKFINVGTLFFFGPSINNVGARFIWVSIYQTAISLLYNDLPFHNMALCLDSHVVPKQKDSEPNKLTLFENYRPNFIMDIDCLYKVSFL